MNRTAPGDAWTGPVGGRGDARARGAAEMTDAAGADHGADMRAIAIALAQLSDAAGGGRAPEPPAAGDTRSALRGAVREIERRQADLDESDPPAIAALPPSDRREAVGGPDGRRPAPPPARADAPERAPAGLKRAGIDLSSEVSQTFARFSRDLREALDATDARPGIAMLDREVRQIGRAVDGLGTGLASAETVARIGEQTREMRDLLKGSTARPLPFGGLEREVAALEGRINRLAAGPIAPPPDHADTVAEVRALLDGFRPGATMAALETRLDHITARIERGLDARDPAQLIEGLSRRVDEIHSSLRSQLAEAAVDTRPLEGLVRNLSERIEQAREASTDFRQLEASLRDAAARIDTAEPRAAQAFEVQLARVAEQLGRSEASLRSLDGVEHTLGELFSQFEVTRQVAIDAAETAARTAARDTLRAALQNPSLAARGADASPAFAEQVSRGLEGLRAQQELSERRTLSTLADLRAGVERLAQAVSAPAGGVRPEPARRDAARRDRGTPAAVEPAVALDPADLLIEPGSGRGAAAPPAAADRAPEPAPAPSLDAAEGDGASSFIAAARRAAQAAQASAASAAAQKLSDRRPAGRPRREAKRMTAGAGDTLARARAFLAQRRRPMLLGLAIVVALVGALEVVRLNAEPDGATRAGAADGASPAVARLPAAPPPDAAPPVRAADAAVLPPASEAPARPPLPSFVAGPARAQAVASPDGVPQGLRDQAAAGDASAQFEVGLRYADGRGVARDARQAVAWFTKAAAQGSAPAAYRLGSAYEKGSGADRDPALAVSWYTKAAEAGNVRAMHNLAVMSAEGAGGKPDYAKAAQWFGKASTFGVRDSEFNLAILYARGLGTEQSLPQSYTWFAIAAAEGDEDAGHKRDEVAAKLDPKALAAAKAAAEAFRAATPSAAANDVFPPPGGWDAAPARAPAPAAAKVSQL